MTPALQATLFIVSLLTLIFITRKVRNAKVKLEDSIFWFCVAGLLLIVSIFPGIFFFLSGVAGTYSTVNFVFLFFIFVLLIQSFSLSMRVSQLDTKLKELTQQLAIEKFERHMNDEKVQSCDDCLSNSED